MLVKLQTIHSVDIYVNTDQVVTVEDQVRSNGSLPPTCVVSTVKEEWSIFGAATQVAALLGYVP